MGMDGAAAHTRYVFPPYESNLTRPSIDARWKALQNSLSGLFCASLGSPPHPHAPSSHRRPPAPPRARRIHPTPRDALRRPRVRRELNSGGGRSLQAHKTADSARALSGDPVSTHMTSTTHSHSSRTRSTST